MSWRSTVVSCCAETSAGNHETSRSVRDSMIAVIYLLLFIAPQILIYLYLRERLPDPARPRQARAVRWGLAAMFTLFNLPWLFVARRVLFGSVWGIGRIPYIAPWIAWQLLGWLFCGLVTLYLTGK